GAEEPLPVGLPAGIAAGGLTVQKSAPLDLEVPPGGVLIATDAPFNRALLAAITGRLTPAAGRLTVLGDVLPFEAARLQRRSVLVHCVETDETSITIGEYLVSRVRLTARFTQRRPQLRLTAGYLRRFESLALTSDSAERIDETTGLRELGMLERWCIDAALALASGRSLIAIDMVGLGHARVPELMNAVSSLAAPDVTLAFATDLPALRLESSLAGRAVVCVTAHVADTERTVVDSTEQEALV
ncbi:MAG: hypothetical protein ABI310_05160, partial [Microbacteriaceae bacterium]